MPPVDLAGALVAIAEKQRTIRADPQSDFCKAEPFMPGSKYTPEPPAFLNSWEFLASKENPGWRQLDFMIRMQLFCGPQLIDTAEYGELATRLAWATHAVFKPGLTLGEACVIVDPVLRGTSGLFQPADLEWNGAHWMGLEFQMQIRLQA